MKKQFMEMEINAIKPRSQQIRSKLGDMLTLENSIKKIGLLNPIIVDQDNVIICGNRRYEACRKAGLAKVPVIKIDVKVGTIEAYDVEADENLCREPLSSEELARLIHAKKIALRPALVRWLYKLIKAIKSFFHKKNERNQ